MEAKDAFKTIGLLKQLAEAADLSAFASDTTLSAAKHLETALSNPARFTAYCDALNKHQHISVLSQAVVNGLKLLQGQLNAPEQKPCIAVAELCHILGGVLILSAQGFPSTHWKDAVQSVSAAGVFKVTISFAGQLTAALNSYCSLQDAEQQQLQEQQVIQLCRLGHGVMRISNGATKHDDHRYTLSTPAVAETLQPAAALALALVRTAEKSRAAGAVPKPVQGAAAQALDVACALAEAIDKTVEVLLSLHDFTPAPCVKQFFASAELQQLLLVYIGSLTASVHRLLSGVQQVSISGAVQAPMQLDIPPWHKHVLAELGAGVAEHLVPGSLTLFCKAAKFTGSSQADAHLHQISRAVNAAGHALECGISSSTQQLQERMLLPLMRMFVEAAALLPDVTSTKCCITGCQVLLATSASQVTRQNVECRGAHPWELSRASSSYYQMKPLPAATAAGILPSVLNLIVPAVLHVLKLDSRTALLEYRKLYNYANEEQLAISRLSLIGNLTSLLTATVISLEPKHLVPAVFRKPLTSLSIFEASIRSAAAENIAPSSQNTSLGEFSKFIQQQATVREPQAGRQMFALNLAVKLLTTCEEAVQSGKLANVLAAPPASMQQQRWAGMMLRQLSGLLITCLKLPLVIPAAGPWAVFCDEVRFGVVFDVLSVVTRIAQLASAEQLSSAVADSTAAKASDAATSSSKCSSGFHGAEWVALTARCLWLLGKTSKAGAAAMQADPQCVAAAGSEDTANLYSVALLLYLQPVIKDTEAAVRWLAGKLGVCTAAVPSKVQKQLQEQQEQLLSMLQVVAKLQGITKDTVAALPEQLQQLPELLQEYGSTVAAWVPQQQFCHNLGCLNLTMLGESALVQGPGKVCAGCCAVRYCGKECQAQDWNSRHKSVCKTLKASDAAESVKA